MIEKAIEQAVLSSYIFDYDAAVSSTLKEDDFNFNSNQIVFKAIKELIKEDLPLDETFILKKIGDYNQNIIIEILATNPIVNVKAYEKDIIEKGIKRKIETQLKMIIAGSSELSSTQLLSKIENLISNNEGNSSLINFQSINNIKAEKPTFFLEDEFPIQKNEINLYSAKGGTGKSWMLLYALARLEEVHNLKGCGWFSEETAGGTKYRINKLSEIYPSFEQSHFNIYNGDEMAQSFVQYGKNKNLEISDFFYQFKNACKEFDIICLDPLIAFYGADENNNAEARFFMNILNNWCKKEDKTILLIHHHNKGEDGTVRGATAFIDAVRMHSVITKEENNHKHIRKLNIEKANHYNGNSEHKIQLFRDYKDSNKLEEIDALKATTKEDIKDELALFGIEVLEKKKIDKKKIKEFDNLEKGGYFG